MKNINWIPITEKEKEIITEMRERGVSYLNIGDKTGLSPSRVRLFCLRNNITKKEQPKEKEKPIEFYSPERNARWVFIYELQKGGCKYPHEGGIPHLFCNAKTNGGSYCQEHLKLVNISRSQVPTYLRVIPSRYKGTV